MNRTRETLIDRLRDAGDERAWSRFFELYPPLIRRFARSRGLSPADADEVRDQCLEIVTREIRSFEYERARGGFRNWLYTITHARVVARSPPGQPGRATARSTPLARHFRSRSLESLSGRAASSGAAQSFSTCPLGSVPMQRPRSVAPRIVPSLSPDFAQWR